MLGERVAQSRIDIVPFQDPTPTRLGARLDPLMVRTPALDVLDREMLGVRDALRVMFARRRRFAQLARDGLGLDAATAQTALEVPQEGNTRLLVSAPPQEGKTTAVSRYGVLWLLRQFPGLRVVIVSFDGVNASRISRLSRNDVELFDGTADNPDLGLRLTKDQKAMSRWSLQSPAGGEVYAIGIGGGLTGRPVDLMLIDDPVKDDAAASSELRSSQAWVWWQSTGRPRLGPGAPVIVVGTRWHEADLIGRLIDKQDEDQQSGLAHFDRWRVVNIPAQADHHPERGEQDVLGRAPGEFMQSARGWSPEQWEATRNSSDIRLWTALYQGKPSPEQGTVWLRQWWRRYDEALWSATPTGQYLINGMDQVMQSWDMSFRDTSQSDYVCGQVWAKRGADAFLIYQVWARLDFTATVDAVIRVSHLFPQSHKKVIEAKANGDAIMSLLQRKIPGMVGSTPTQSKYARAEAVSPFIRAGNVHLPTSSVALQDPELRWDPDALILEARSFPFGAHDDQVDATSQALGELFLGMAGEVSILTAKGRIPEREQRPGSRLGSVQQRLTRQQLRR